MVYTKENINAEKNRFKLSKYKKTFIFGDKLADSY